jgi:SHS2 domain-containing protein
MNELVSVKVKKDFEAILHTADLHIRAYGDTLEELFHNALVGMFQSLEPQALGCNSIHDRVVCAALPQKHSLVVTSPDCDALLVDFLSEALYLSAVHYEAYLDVTIEELTGTQIKATLHGVKVTGFAGAEIKAATYHGLHIQQKDSVWQTDIIFDI